MRHTYESTLFERVDVGESFRNGTLTCMKIREVQILDSEGIARKKNVVITAGSSHSGCDSKVLLPGDLGFFDGGVKVELQLLRIGGN